MTRHPSLRGTVCLVTGGTRGIGRAVAEGLAQVGARLALLGRDAERLTAAADALAHEHGAEVCHRVVDVGDEDSVVSAFDAVVERFGTVDGLVNNAGQNLVGPSLDYPLAEWRRVLEINLTGAFACTQRAAQIMRKAGGGSIVNITSMTSFTGQPERAAYIASKSGLLGMTRSLAVEWGPLGIRVNAVAPGYIRTDLVDGLVERGVLDPQVIETRTPLRRMGQPEDVVGAVLHLLSDDSKFSTGQTVTVDGGWLANGYFR